MTNQTSDDNARKKWSVLRFIWGSLPVLVLFLIILFLGMAISAKSQRLEAEKKASYSKKETAINVVTLKTAPLQIQDRINLPGMIEPWVKLGILCEVNGKVVQKIRKEGTRVQKGDLIAVIDSRDYENALRSAKALYQVAQASQKRIEKLYDEQLATRSQLDDVLALVETRKAQMDSAALNVDRCEIRSPIAGVLDKLHIEKGDYLTISSPVANILQIDTVKVTIGIPESDVNAVRSLENFEVKIDALNGRIFQAKKRYLSRSTSNLARLYDLELTIPNPDRRILPDMFARVEIVKQAKDNAIAIPLFSILSIGDTHVAYVVKDNTVEARKVELGIQDGWKVQITRGIQADEQVVVVGQRNVNAGQKVNVIKTISNLEALSG